MRMHSAKPHRWSWVAAISVSALLVAMLGLALVPADVGAQSFNPVVDATLSDNEHEANADITTIFEIPITDYQYGRFYAFTPEEFFPDEDVPIGALVGSISATATLGLANGPCYTGLEPSFEMFRASTDTSSTVTFDGQFIDLTGDGLHDGIDQYPDFLTRILPGATPIERVYGDTSLSGQNISVSIVTLEAGDLPGFPAALGRPSVTVLNDIGDPAAEPTPLEAISDFCTPLETTIVTLGLSEDNPATGDDEAGFQVRRNPHFGGTYTFSWYAESMPDAEGDGYENYGDTCPYDANIDNSFKVDTGPDGDGIDASCEIPMRVSDPTWPATKPCWPGAPGSFADCDKDFFFNRGDNCPLVANPDQLDDDSDSIGNACDQDDETPDGAPIPVSPQASVEISGPLPGEETATPTPTATTAAATGTATATGTSTATGTATPTAVAGEGCAPVIPGTYNGLVRLNGVPAAAGYEVTATIDGTEWGSTIVSGGRYALDVPQKLPAAEPCFAGGTITFTINGGTCTPTEEWASGLHDVDLSCAPAATPPPATPPPATPPPATPPPATPVVTPAKPPVTGSGGLGGDQGLPLWAMVVIGWAGLTALAGFGTLATRIVKR